MLQIVILAMMVLSSMTITACKEIEHLDPKSLQSANDQAKIAVNYLGDDNCRSYLTTLEKSNEEIAQIIRKNRSASSHLLDGKDGELITEEYRTSTTKRKSLKLSGDRFFDRNPTGDEALTIETIEENCRRLLLSVDSSKKPEITLKHGFIAKDQQKLFSTEFSNKTRFGEITCHDDKFCTFSKINNGNRYFVYLEPVSTHSDIVLGLSYHVDEKNISIDTVTVKNIKFDDINRYQDKQPLDYVSHLYVALDKSDDFTWTQNYERHFKVALELGSDTQKTIEAGGVLKLNDDVAKQVVSFKLATICQKFPAGECNEDFSNIQQLLLENEARLSFVFSKKEGWLQTSKEIERKTMKLTRPFIDNWFQRKGEIYFGKNLDSHWSSFKFIFTNTKQKYLYLHPTELPRNSRYTIINQICKNNGFSGIFSPPDRPATIDRQALINHFVNNDCTQLGENVGNLEYLKQALLVLVIQTDNQEEYRYMFTDASIDNWWHEIGEVTATAQTKDEGSGQPAKQLIIGLQDRK